jgi:uncharacterized membrane-anchored protein YhcB (DUF1043 family)
MSITISQVWGVALMALACGILVGGIVLDIRIAANRKRRERQRALRSGAILTGKGGGK